ncbi:MAG: DUF1667 domain-containing protein [Ruminococcus sp.]
MNKTFTCILCPNGCEICTSFNDDEILSVTGNKCSKGAAYVEQEIKNPLRNIASSVLVEDGDMPLCSVRLSAPVPKRRIPEVMAEIRKISVTAPVKTGDILLADVLGLGSDVIATRNVEKSLRLPSFTDES